MRAGFSALLSWRQIEIRRAMNDIRKAAGKSEEKGFKNMAKGLGPTRPQAV
jgi:hypothetical protein